MSAEGHRGAASGRTYASDEMVDNGGFEDVTERNPVEETQHSFEGDLDERRLVGLLEHLDAKRENFCE